MTFPNHMIEQAMSTVYDVPDSAGLSVVMLTRMSWWKENKNKKVGKIYSPNFFQINENILFRNILNFYTNTDSSIWR